MTIPLREYAIAITLVAIAQTSYIAGDLIKNTSDDTTRIDATALQSNVTDALRAGIAGGAVGGNIAAQAMGGSKLPAIGNVGNIAGSIPNVNSLTNKLGGVGGGNPMSSLQNAAAGQLGNVANGAMSQVGSQLGNLGGVGDLAGKAQSMLGVGQFSALNGMFPGLNLDSLPAADQALIGKCVQENMPPQASTGVGAFGVSQIPSGTENTLGAAVKGGAPQSVNETSEGGSDSDTAHSPDCRTPTANINAADAEACWSDFKSKVDSIAPQMGVTMSWKEIENASTDTLRSYATSDASNIFASNSSYLTKKMDGVSRYVQKSNDAGKQVYIDRMQTIINKLQSL